MVRGSKLIPGRAQNVFEWFYEFLSDFGIGIAGPGRQAVHPAVRGVLPAHPVLQLERARPAGRADRASCARPTSDVNVTLGLALVSFIYFEFQGFQRLGFGGYARQVLPALRVQERDRGGRHRAVRRSRRAHARVRQAGHAVDATLRQHLRRRGRARRHHRADDRVRPGRPARPRGHAQRDPGAHLQHPDAHVHRPRHREPRARGGSRRRGGPRRARTGRSRRRSSPPTDAPPTAQPTIGLDDPGRRPGE